MMWRSSPLQARPIRRLARCGIVLPVLLAVTGCGSESPSGTARSVNGSAPSAVAKSRLEKLHGESGVTPRSQAR